MDDESFLLVDGPKCAEVVDFMPVRVQPLGPLQPIDLSVFADRRIVYWPAEAA